MRPPIIAPAATPAAPAEGCVVVQVSSYVPPAELAGAVALWAFVLLAVAAAVYLVARAIARPGTLRAAWWEGYAQGRALRPTAEAEVVPFPGKPAA